MVDQRCGEAGGALQLPEETGALGCPWSLPHGMMCPVLCSYSTLNVPCASTVNRALFGKP